MNRRLLIVEEDQGQEHPRDPRWEELQEILDQVLAQLIAGNQGAQNLMEFLEARLVHVALEQARHNKARAARQLGVPRKRLERRARKYQAIGK
ncbi:MAG: hypothetical protein HYW07_00650 [Candidatus Latescibacteria bacterium]|nr:hypothetical protein [Candidatus Latescibacterota bacterium]